jgi:hypothetical protein
VEGLNLLERQVEVAYFNLFLDIQKEQTADHLAAINQGGYGDFL